MVILCMGLGVCQPYMAGNRCVLGCVTAPRFSFSLLKSVFIFIMSQLTIPLSSQTIITPDSQEMPRQWTKKQRRGSGRFSYAASRAVSRVPRAIQTRGTPNGYYEIPVNVLIRLYFNSTTGVWPTNQTNNQPTGLTGYEGFAIRYDHNNIALHFGNGGAINTSSTIAIPNSTELAAIFDEYKQVRVDQEYWMANQTSTVAATLAHNPEYWVVEDQNDAFPPTSNQIQAYAKSTRVLTDRPVKCTHYQKVLLDASSDAGGGASTAAGPMTNTYMKTVTGASLLGTKVYFWIPTNSSGTAYVGYLNIKLTIVRRYKKTI